jgi:transcriptional regulator GlxA family with amidase domain
VSGQKLYRWSLSSENGTQALFSNQTITLVDYDFLSMPTVDQLFLVSGVDVKEAATPELIALLRRQHAHGTQPFAKKVSDGHAPTTCT